MWFGSFLRKYFFSLVTTLGTVGVAVSGTIAGIWLFDEYSRLINGSTTEEEISRLQIFTDNIFSLSTPIPWYTLSVVALFIGTAESYFNRYMYGVLGRKEIKLREETQAHGESKINFHKALQATLQHLLTKNLTGFNESCRVTIYRQQTDGDDYLKRIFRYSQTTAYSDAGRTRIPLNEGIVGVAWKNHGEEEFSCDEPPTSKNFQDNMNAKVCDWNCNLPGEALSMPSKHYFAKAVRHNDANKNQAIVVYESTEVGLLDVDGIRKLMADETLDVSHFIRHLGVLDEELYPDPKGERHG